MIDIFYGFKFAGEWLDGIIEFASKITKKLDGEWYRSGTARARACFPIFMLISFLTLPIYGLVIVVNILLIPVLVLINLVLIISINCRK